MATQNGELKGQIKTMDTAATALAALGLSVPTDWDGKPVWAALKEGVKVSMNGKQLPIIAEWKGNHCGITEPKRVVITDPKEWAEIWKQIHRGKIPVPEVPAIDFNKNMVLAVFVGQKPTSGYAIQIAEVTRSNGEVVAKLKETAPAKGTIVLQVLTQPFHIVVVPKVDAQVRFVE